MIIHVERESDMNRTSLRFFGIKGEIKNDITEGRPINKQEYQKTTDELQYTDALKIDRFFASLLCKKFGERKVNEAMDNSDDELCEAHAYLESQK